MSAAVLLSACGGDDDDSAGMSTEAAADMSGGDGALAPAATQAPSATDRTVAGAPESPAATAPSAGGIDLGTIGRDVIVELHVQMETDDIARSVAAITADAVTAGGGVASSDISYGDGDGRGHAVLVLKVPPAEVNRVLGNLEGTGRVLSVNQSAQDVTDQLIDLDVRIDNKRESVENVRRMMEQTTDLGQLVTLENELTWRQTELEQLEAQQRNLSDRVAMSTLTIEIRAVEEIAETPADTDDDTIGDAFAKGWDAFREVLFGIAFVLAALTPFIVTAAIAAAFVWVVVRIRRRPVSAASSPLEPPATPDRDDELTPV